MAGHALTSGGIYGSGILAAGRRRLEAPRMTCRQCLSVTGPDAACCGSCGTPAASVSQFPRTPGDQYIPSAALPALRSRQSRG